jgi:hypothetical protein
VIMAWNKLNLVGQRFGKLLVIREAAAKKNNCVTWVCQCACGKITEVTTTHLRRGAIKSCGCLRMKDLTGSRFGKLVVKNLTDSRSGGSAVWLCHCDCGVTTHVSSSSLQRGTTVSCGCKKKGARKLAGKRYGRLVAENIVGQLIVGRNYLWKCRCDCGGQILASSSNLVSGHVRSCGCLCPEVTRKRLMTREGAVQISKMHLARNSCLNTSDLPNELVEAYATRIEINREIRRITDEKY